MAFICHSLLGKPVERDALHAGQLNDLLVLRRTGASAFRLAGFFSNSCYRPTDAASVRFLTVEFEIVWNSSA